MQTKSPFFDAALHVRDSLHAKACSIYESVPGETGRRFRLSGSTGGTEAAAGPADELTACEASPWVGFTSFAAFKNRTLRIGDASTEQRFVVDGVEHRVVWDQKSCELCPPGPFLAVPITRGDEVVGVVRVVRTQGDSPFLDQDESMLRDAIAPFLAISIAQEQSRAQLVTGLLDIARFGTVVLGDEDAVLEAIATQAVRLVRSEQHQAAAVFLADLPHDHQGEPTSWRFRAPRTTDSFKTSVYRKGDKGLTPSVLQGRRDYILSGNLRADTAPNGPLADTLHEPKDAEVPAGLTMSFVAVPIYAAVGGSSASKPRILGAIRVSATQRYAFSHRDVQTLRALADQTSQILEMLRRLREREVLFETLVNTTDHAIAALDTRGKISVFNAAACRIFGIGKPPLKQHVVDVVYGGNPHLAKATRVAIARAAAQGLPLTDYHTVCYRTGPSGYAMPIAVRVQAAQLQYGDANQAKETTGTIGILEDVATPDWDTDVLVVGDQTHKGVTSDRRIIDQLAKLQSSKVLDTVTVQGPSGSGKGLIVRHLNASLKLARELRVVSCSELKDELFESQMFGTIEGSFTNAKTRFGILVPDKPISVLLDDLQDLSPACQAKLLRVVQESCFRRVGEQTEHKVDVQWFVATWDDLEQAVKQQRFRSDLYYRLEGDRIVLPSLKDRKGDIILLADFFLKEANKEFDVEVAGFASEVIRGFLEYRWPGNVRELSKVIRNAVRQREVKGMDLLELPLFPPKIAEAALAAARPTTRVLPSRRDVAVESPPSPPAEASKSMSMRPWLIVEAGQSAIGHALEWDQDAAFRAATDTSAALRDVLHQCKFTISRSQLSNIWRALQKQRKKK